MDFERSSFIQKLNPQLARTLQNRVNIFASIDSTNSYLANATEPSLCIAWQQTAGRGQRDKTWVSHCAGSVSISFAWVFPAATPVDGLSLACGIALADCLVDMGCKPQVKWPNDLLLGSKKIAGILVEIHPHTNSQTAVIGAGLNLTQPPDQAISRVGLHATSLSQHLAQPPDRLALCAAIAGKLYNRLTQFAASGFASMQADWNTYHCWGGRQVCLSDNKQKVTGKCLGVDATGKLLIDTSKGAGEDIRVFHSGSLLLMNP